jgi:ubiquinone/menaquinone biosynthesis C-methylase UbiE
MADNRSQQQNHWKNLSCSDDVVYEGWLKRWTIELQDLIGITDFTDKVVLNVGGGPVPLRFPNAKEEILLDNNADWFEDIYPKKYREGVTVVDGNIETNCLPPNHVDICYCRKTLEYIEDWKTALKEMNRMLKINGIIILMFHEKQSDGINLNLLNRMEVADYLGDLGVYGLYSYIYDEASTYVQIAGVKHVKKVP